MERAAERGDLTAFGVLFERHQARLVAFLTRFLGERATAEDIAQEAFWKVWQNRAQFNPKQSFRVYLYVAAKNLALSDRTSAYSRHTVLSDFAPERAEPDDENTPLDAALQNHLRCAVRQALQALPEDQRLCVLLHEYDGYTYGEIARILNCSIVSARVLGFRARKRLAQLLEPLMEEKKDAQKKL